MIKKILLSAILSFAMVSTTAWAQGCGGGDGCGSVGTDYFSSSNCGCNDCCTSKYVRMFAGWNFLDDIETPAAGTVASEIDFSDGWAAGIALGRRNGSRRTELEFTHRHNSYDQLVGGAVVGQGNISTAAVMANVLFDLKRLQTGNVNVYAGGGLGLAYADVHATFPVDSAGYDTGFAYQAIAGLEKELSSGAKAFAEYRYFASEFDFGSGDLDYDAHNLFFGIELRR